MTKQKACIVMENNLNEGIEFLFNPSELTIERTNQFNEVNIPGQPSSLFQFVKGGSRTLTMDIFFDTYEKRQDVRDYTDIITGWESEDKKGNGLMDIDPETHAPPICRFIWGKFIFPCIIERVSKKFTMFLSDGTPVRATLNISLKEKTEIISQNKGTPKNSADRTKVWVVKEGDSLWLIANVEYGDPGLWRPIAEANNIDNPRFLKPGTDIIIPPLE